MHHVAKWLVVLPAVALLAACEPSDPATPLSVVSTPTGAEDYQTFCAACHGPGGKGDGPAADGFGTVRPADLTGITARNGGTYPGTRVMATIYGYAQGTAGPDRVMPMFGALLQSETAMYDGGDGIKTPTPLRLVQLAEYVKGLHGR